MIESGENYVILNKVDGDPAARLDEVAATIRQVVRL